MASRKIYFFCYTSTPGEKVIIMSYWRREAIEIFQERYPWVPAHRIKTEMINGEVAYARTLRGCAIVDTDQISFGGC